MPNKYLVKFYSHETGTTEIESIRDGDFEIYPNAEAAKRYGPVVAGIINAFACYGDSPRGIKNATTGELLWGEAF